MRIALVLCSLALAGCGGTSVVETGCLIGTSHVGQTCRGEPVYRDAHDGDADGIHDDDDLCPGTPGHGTTNGCPPHETE